MNYDAIRLHELLKSFYLLTKMSIGMYGTDYSKIAEYPGQGCEFCARIRRDPNAEKNCLISDRDALAHCREQNRFYSYICHAGLMEVIVPIRHGSVVIGYMMFGQLLQRDDKDEYWPEVKRRCARYDVGEKELKEAFYRIKPAEMDQILAAVMILEACSGYLWMPWSAMPAESSMPTKIDEYISENIEGDLSAAALCSNFQISRSKLYRISKEYFGMGIERVVRTRRIIRAKELLMGASIPISEIAHRIGFPDYNYFIRVFKTEVGLTPLRYRKQNQ